MVDPNAPDKPINVAIGQRQPIRELAFATSNYTDPLRQFAFTPISAIRSLSLSSPPSSPC